MMTIILKHKAIKKYGKPEYPIDLNKIINKDVNSIISLLGHKYDIEKYNNGRVFTYNLKTTSPTGNWKIRIEPNKDNIIKAYEITFKSPLSMFLTFGRMKSTWGSKILGSDD